jgi:hypothetical protein
MKLLLVFLLVFPSVTLLAQADIPSGTLLPVMLLSSINQKSKPGDAIKARLMQDVALRPEASIPAGSHLLGHIVQVSPSSVSLVLDQLRIHNHPVDLRTSLRAIASMMEIHDAQLPADAISGGDRGSTELDWVTRQVGGDIVYGRRGGDVMRHGEVVGHSLLGGGVVAIPIDAAGSRCPASADDEVPQAMWLFSASACGAYGFEDLKINNAGESDPIGTIVLTSAKKIHIRSGSGLLLSVEGE